MPSHLTQIR